MNAAGTIPVHPSNVDQAAAWDGAGGDSWAEHADHFDLGVAEYRTAFLEAARIGADSRVLDIGCGTGQTTRDAARLAGAGSALGVDLSARMLAVAWDRAAAEGVSNARFEQADAQIHPFPAGAFDVAISRTGAMFFGDGPAAFANIARALRPGARLVLLTWQPPAANEWFRTFHTVLTGRPVPEPAPDAPGPFSLSDPDHVRGLLQRAGFTEVALTDVRRPMYYGPDPDAAQRFVLEVFGWALRDRHPAEVPDAIAALRASLRARTTADGVRYGSACWLVTARRS
jgi:SAM-dependent methyltransferase